MASAETSAADATAKTDEKSAENEITMSKIEAMVTPEQVLSASVARRRRNVAKKRSSSVKRDRTPMRDEHMISSSSDEGERTKPRTPERPRRRVQRTASENLKKKVDDIKKSQDITSVLLIKKDMEATTVVSNTSQDKEEIASNATDSISTTETPTEENKLENCNVEPTEKNDTNISNIHTHITETIVEMPRVTDISNEVKTLDIPAPTKEIKEDLPPPSTEDKKERPTKTKRISKDEKEEILRERKSKSVSRAGSVPKNYEDAKTLFKDGMSALTNITQDDVKALFQKARNKMTPDKVKKKKELQRRSQSTPHQFTEEELLESFKKAQLISDTGELLEIERKDRSIKRYSSSSCTDAEKPERILPQNNKAEKTKIKELRPDVKEFVTRRKQTKIQQDKIIQLIDPRSSKILKTRAQYQLPFRFFDFLKVMRLLTIKDMINEFKEHKIDMKSEGDKIRLMRNRCIGELMVLMIFCGLGGIMFKTTEGAFENFYKCGVKRVKRDFIDQLWSRSHNMREDDWKSLARTRLRIFEEELHTAHEAGMRSYSGQRSWSFLNGIVYCLTIVTTIGYGHMYPTTTTGRALTIVYAIIGIPLFLIILTDFGKLLTRIIKYFWSYVRRLYYTGSCRRVRKQAHMEDIMKGAQFMYEVATFRRPSMFADPEANADGGSNQNTNTPTTPAPSNFEIDDEFNLPISLAIFILVSYIFVGSLVYLYYEDWKFFESFYFVFISMSTIGFGDYVPRHPVCMIVSIVYLVFGLALMSMCINVVQAKLSDTFKQASAKLGATIGLTVADEDGSITTIPIPNVEIPQVHEPKREETGEKS